MFQTLWICSFIIIINCGFSLSTEYVVMNFPNVSPLKDSAFTDISDSKYVAQLMKLVATRYIFICGATIIESQFVLTPARFVLDIDKTDHFILVGTQYQAKNGTIIPINDIKIHSNFSSQTFDYDIAIIKLGSKIGFDNTHGCIPIGSKKPPLGEAVKIFGYRQKNEYELTPVLESAEIRVIPNMCCEADINCYKVCLTKSRTTIPYHISPPAVRIGNGSTYALVVNNTFAKHSLITKNMFCAGYGNPNTCVGNAGNPVVYEDSLVGLTSFGYDSCSEGVLKHSVYTDVIELLDWIDGMYGGMLGTYDFRWWMMCNRRSSAGLIRDDV